MQKLSILIVIAGMSWASLGGAETGSSQNKLNYLSSGEINVATVIAAPPATGSAINAQDLAQVLSLQGSRTQADCDRANVENHLTFTTLFGAPYGPLSATEISKWQGFFDKIYDDVDSVVGLEKKYWKRDRPFVDHSEVTPCLPTESSYSYPSGHATISRVFADVLDVLDPSRKAIFDARADQIALDRVLGGVHYPTDIAAGKLFGDLLFSDLQRSELFETDLAAAQSQATCEITQ